jgi:hypothetical protein
MSNLLYIALVYYFSYSFGLCPIRPKEGKKKKELSHHLAVQLHCLSLKFFYNEKKRRQMNSFYLGLLDQNKKNNKNKRNLIPFIFKEEGNINILILPCYF